LRIKRFKNTITKKYISLLNRMSNSASISAAKKRRGGGPPPMGNVGGGQGQAMGMPPGLPPGLPPNFRQLPPHIQQQLFMQLQQRAAAAAAAAKSAPPPMQGPGPQQQQSMPPAPIQTRVPTPGQGVGSMANTQGPYTVNNVLHNRAMAEVNGVHIRDLPISAAGLPCLPSGAALPPNVLFKLHHDELLNMDAVLNEHSNKIQLLLNRVDKGAGASAGVGTVSYNSDDNSSRNITDYDGLVNNTAFITKLLDNILTNTNLSDIINQIEPLQKENESLRALLNSQQTTLNELSGLVMKLLSNGLPSYSSYSNNDNNDNNDNIENIENIENRVYDSYDNTMMNGVSSVYNPNTDQYMGQKQNGTVYDANILDSGCTLTVTDLEDLDEGEENEEEGEEEGEDVTDEKQED